MNRRGFVLGILALPTGVVAAQANTNAGTFDALLALFDSDPTLVEDAWQYRDLSVPRGVGRGAKSPRKISRRAIQMIVDLEVGSPRRYERLYRGPIWPRGESGVTIGIGYDLRFASREILHRDWDGLIGATAASRLEPALGLGGPAAREMLARLNGVDVPWSAAQTQFLEFLPYPTAETENVFSNCSALSDDSFGALVSLVYNRGSAIPRNKASRAEMVRIHDLMEDRQFDRVPAQIRSMKRLWTSPDSRGLVIRRELEARLFEMGLG